MVEGEIIIGLVLHTLTQGKPAETLACKGF